MSTLGKALMERDRKREQEKSARGSMSETALGAALRQRDALKKPEEEKKDKKQPKKQSKNNIKKHTMKNNVQPQATAAPSVEQESTPAVVRGADAVKNAAIAAAVQANAPKMKLTHGTKELVTQYKTPEIPKKETYRMPEKKNAVRKERTLTDVEKEMNNVSDRMKSDLSKLYSEIGMHASENKNPSITTPEDFISSRPTFEMAVNKAKSKKAVTDTVESYNKNQEIYNNLSKEHDALKKQEYYESIPYSEDFERYRDAGKDTLGYKKLILKDMAKNAAQNQMESMGTIGVPDYSYESAYSDYTYITDTDYDIMAYLSAKEGKEAAKEYRDYIQERLNRLVAQAQFDDVKGITALELVSGVKTGTVGRLGDSVKDAVNLAIGKKANPVSKNEYYSSMVREDLEDVGPKVLGHSLGQIAFDLIDNTSNMAVFAPFGGVGAAAGMGLSAGATSANEAWREGNSRGEAIGYGVVNGALEGGLQYLLGGVKFAGKKKAGKVSSALSDKFKSTAGKFFSKELASAFEEGREEYLQEIIDPAVRNIMLDENNELHFFTKDAAYAGLLGALSGPTLSAGSNISESKKEVAFEKVGRVYK